MGKIFFTDIFKLCNCESKLGKKLYNFNQEHKNYNPYIYKLCILTPKSIVLNGYLYFYLLKL